MMTASPDEGLLGRFGDERLNRVGRDFLAAMVSQRSVNIKRLGGSRSQEVRFGRFLHNEDVTVAAALAHAADESDVARRGATSW